MSLLGKLNDWITGQPSGTTDQIAATDAQTNAQLQALNDQQLASGLITQSQYDTMTADVNNEPGTSAADQLAGSAGALVSGAGQAAENPGQVLQTGLTWEGQQAANVAAGVTSGASNALGRTLGGIFKNLSLTAWIVIAVVLFLWLGGGGFLERKARAKLSQ